MPRSLRAITASGGHHRGCFLTTASHGTEQLMVQRLLAARNERGAGLPCSLAGPSFSFSSRLFLAIA